MFLKYGFGIYILSSFHHLYLYLDYTYYSTYGITGQTIKNFIYKKGNSNNTISLDIIIYILHHDFRHIKMFQVYQMA